MTAITKEIEQLLEEHRIILFMKGTKITPMCGFSNRVVKILMSYSVPFHTINVLESDEMREGIKAFTDWPTIPQLYVDKEFIGGCDIICQLDQTSALEGILSE